MFTGIVEGTGVVVSVSNRRMRVATHFIGRSKIVIGNSISVNGVCVTVVKSCPRPLFFKKVADLWFEFEISNTTTKKTTLGNLKKNSLVNIERAVRACDRMSGHFVSGNVFYTGVITAFTQVKKSYFLTVSMPKKYMTYMIPEGSVTLDGVSLTIAGVKGNTITCNIIPHTYATTTLSSLTEGSLVNVEPDIIARYIVKLK